MKQRWAQWRAARKFRRTLERHSRDSDRCDSWVMNHLATNIAANRRLRYRRLPKDVHPAVIEMRDSPVLGAYRVWISNRRAAQHRLPEWAWLPRDDRGWVRGTQHELTPDGPVVRIYWE